MNNPMFGNGSVNRNNMLQQFQQFRQQMQGVDPQQKVQELLRSGQMTQQQFEQFRQLANMFFPNGR